MKARAFDRTIGALIILAALVGGTYPAAAGDGFPAAVERILMNQSEGQVARLDAEKKRALVACVNEVLTAMPGGMKRFVLEAADYDEMEDRFGKVVLQNRAEWKQKIALGCAHIVV